ncbi:MAG TPA: MATE family efflux transporter [Clostridiales bacterium]|nr:MATE family efflux transporter [Clostridiales bacterium]
MKIRISDSFNLKKTLEFTLPSIVMCVFTSIYGVVDGFFVSNVVGKTAFSAVNFIMPVLMLMGCLGFMFGTGGSALVSKTMGEGDYEKANGYFSLIIYANLILGVIIAVLGFIFLEPIAKLLRAGDLLEDCLIYGRIIILAVPFYMTQYAFQAFFVTANKPGLGLTVTVISGVTNMALDALFMAVFKWGLIGAASATAISQFVGGIIPLVYFFSKNNSLLRLGRTKFETKVLLKTCGNGSSEVMTNISMSLVNILYNVQLMKFAGNDGVAAYGVLMYVNMIFLSVYLGYSTGIAPVIGYNYGAKNEKELKGLFKRSLLIICVSAVFMFGLAELLATPLAKLFVGYDKELMVLTKRGFFIFSFAFLFNGFSIFGSAFFTALSDGLVSALISFLRFAFFQTVCILIFPIFLKTDGIWLSVAVAEFSAAIMTAGFLIAKRKKYNYI